MWEMNDTTLLPDPLLFYPVCRALQPCYHIICEHNAAIIPPAGNRSVVGFRVRSNYALRGPFSSPIRLVFPLSRRISYFTFVGFGVRFGVTTASFKGGHSWAGFPARWAILRGLGGIDSGKAATWHLGDRGRFRFTPCASELRLIIV